MRKISLRRGAALVLAAALTGTALPAVAVDYVAQAPHDWALAEVERANGLDITGFGRYTDYFGNVTRMEFAVLAVKLYTAHQPTDTSTWGGASPFTDVNAVYVTAANQLGLMNGVGDGLFAPDREISRAEICTLFHRLLTKLEVQPDQPLAAEAAALVAGSEGPVADWAKAGVESMVAAGVMKGTDHGYALTDQTTREQAAILALRVYDMVQARKDELAAQDRAERDKVFTAAELARIAELEAMRKSMEAARYTGESPYTQEPDLDLATCAPGALQEGFLRDGLNAINYARAIAGLPADVTYSAEMNAKAQVGALLLAVGEFSHTPAQPDGMDDALYQNGYDATSSSNIGSGHRSLYDFNLSCMDDSDPGNLSRVGHRRWLLSPNLKTVGMGYVDRSSATKVVDKSRTPAIDPDLVCWPAQGVFPADLATKRLGWSCSIDPKTYSADGVEKITVTMTRERDGAVFELDQSMNDATGTGPYLRVDKQTYGYRPAIIFRPGVEGYEHGDVFHVEIHDVPLQSGGKTTISYTTKFYTPAD